MAESDVIVAGRLGSYTLLPDAPRVADFMPIRIEMTVDRVYKGEVPGSTIVIIDRSSLELPHGDGGDYRWSGASGACGVFDTDPTGQYAVLGLKRNDDGTFQPNRLLTFFLGPDPEGERYRQALARMASYPGAAGLPALGSGPGATHAAGPFVVPSLLGALGGGLLALALVLRRRDVETRHA